MNNIQKFHTKNEKILSMNYFYLLFLLPADLVHYIYLINLKESAASIIYKFYKFNLKRPCIINKLLRAAIKDHICVSNTYKFDLLEDSSVNKLKFILKHNFNRERYNKIFWECFLNVLSDKLMRLHTYIQITNMNFNKNKYYTNLKLAIKIWFQLCQKHNIQFRLYYSNKIIKNCYARHLIKLDNFSKYLHYPNVIINNYQGLCNNHAVFYLKLRKFIL